MTATEAEPRHTAKRGTFSELPCPRHGCGAFSGTRSRCSTPWPTPADAKTVASQPLLDSTCTRRAGGDRREGWRAHGADQKGAATVRAWRLTVAGLSWPVRKVFVPDPATLIVAFDRVAGNHGANTPAWTA